MAITGRKVMEDFFVQWHGNGDWHMGHGMMDWGYYGISWFWHISMIVFWIAIIVGIVFLIRWLIISTRNGFKGPNREDSDLEILRKRYAQGEINKEEFEEKKRDLLA
jgi:putative membrane protein